MPKVLCPDCDQEISMHELETKTVAQSDGFETSYRCPFCGSDVPNVTDHLV